jgi:integrase
MHSMGIYRRKSGSGVTYYAQYRVDGEVVRESLRTGHVGEARLRYAELMERVAAGEARTKATVANLAHAVAWQTYETHALRVKRANTVANEKLFWGSFWGWTPKGSLHSITRDDVAGWQDYLRRTPCANGNLRSPHTVNDALRNMCVVFSHLISIGAYSGSNPFSGKLVARLPVPKPRPKFLSRDESTATLAASERAGRDIHLVFALGLLAGLRKSEMLNLRWRDVHWDRVDQSGDTLGCLYIWSDEGFQAKTDESQRVIPLHPTLSAILGKYRPMVERPDEYVIKPGMLQGGKRYRWEFKRPFLDVVKPLGRSVSVHMLRHTFASQLAMSGVSVYKISRWMGHSSVTTTEIYAHLCPVDNDIARLGE